MRPGLGAKGRARIAVGVARRSAYSPRVTPIRDAGTKAIRLTGKPIDKNRAWDLAGPSTARRVAKAPSW
jgi:hypothetical protein